MSGFAASWKCFYCSNPINADGEFVYSTIEHRYVDGTTRESDRRFHSPCFEKFEAHGRPYNPRTDYAVVEASVIKGSIERVIRSLQAEHDADHGEEFNDGCDECRIEMKALNEKWANEPPIGARAQA